MVGKESKVVKVGQGARRACPQLIHPPTYPTLPRWAASVEKVGKEMVQKKTGRKKMVQKSDGPKKEMA